MALREMWGRLVATNYTRALEREVARLRAENRALLNSILGIAGVPQIVVSADEGTAPVLVEFVTETTAHERCRASETESDAGNRARSQNASALNVKEIGQRASAQRGMKSVAAPMRRRSWHQIYRMLEIDAARKKEAG
jgi:hypothetical protein